MITDRRSRMKGVFSESKPGSLLLVVQPQKVDAQWLDSRQITSRTKINLPEEILLQKYVFDLVTDWVLMIAGLGQREDQVTELRKLQPDVE